MIRTETLDEMYNTKRITIGKKDSLINFTESMAKEVESYTIKERKKLFAITSGILMMILPTTISSQRVSASNLVEVDYTSSLIPSEISTILMELISMAGKIGILVAILMLIVAGFMKMFGQSEKSRKMSKDIIKGFGQVLLAPIIIMILVTITRLLLGGVDGLRPFF